MKTQAAFKNRFIWLVTLFLISTIFSWTLYFRNFAQPDTVSIHNFPMTVGEWTAEEIPISKYDYALLETRNAFVRKYTNAEGKKIYLFVVYSQHNRKVSHPPEICLTGGGGSILANYPINIYIANNEQGAFQVNQLDLALGTTKPMALYWYKIGDSYTSNYWKQQGMIAMKTLLGQPSASALVRISSEVLKSKNETLNDLEKFINLILPELAQHLPR